MRILPIRKPNHIEMENGEMWPIYKSSGYMSLTHDGATLITQCLSESKIIKKFFHYTFVPEELVFPTIIFNSSLRNNAKLVNNREACSNLIEISAIEEFDYGKSIKVFTEEDFHYLMTCGKMFARKLETGKSDRLMDMIDSVRDK